MTQNSVEAGPRDGLGCRAPLGRRGTPTYPRVMKKLACLAFLAASLAVSARALIIGADVGYLLDNQDEILSARVGHAFKTGTGLSHQVELEYAYTSHDESFSLLGAPVTATTKLKPLTLNYRAETTTQNKLGFHYGVGVGLAQVSFSRPGSGVGRVADDDSALAAQAFAGVSYQATEAVALRLGAKYLWVDDVTLAGSRVKAGDDVALSAGLSVKF